MGRVALQILAPSDGLHVVGAPPPAAPGTPAVLPVHVAGEVQTDEFSLPQPDGGSGRDTINVSAA